MHFRNAAFERGSDGSVKRVLGIARDITEQILAQEASRHSEEQLRKSLQYQQALNEINIQIADLETFDEICKTAIELGLERLGFDRLGLILYEPGTGIIREPMVLICNASYGTNITSRSRYPISPPGSVNRSVVKTGSHPRKNAFI